MAKFILSVGDQTFRILCTEARKRDVTVQQLLRAVILPEWAKDNLELKNLEPSPREIAPHLMRSSMYRSQQEPLLLTGTGHIRR
jgi:hypothetical protein